MTTPADIVRAMVDHHLWATSELLDALENVDAAKLDSSIPGTYGTALETLTHLLDADDRYLQRLESPRLPSYEDRDSQPIPELRQRLARHHARWNEALDRLEAGTLDARIEQRPDYPDTPHAEGMLLVQAIHHGNDHRTQICSTLGALGQDVPEIDGWDYWAAGRSTEPSA